MTYVKIEDRTRLFYCKVCCVLQQLAGDSHECPMCMCESLEAA